MGIIHAGVEDVDLGMLSQGRRMASRARETDGNPSHVSSGGRYVCIFWGPTQRPASRQSGHLA